MWNERVNDSGVGKKVSVQDAKKIDRIQQRESEDGRWRLEGKGDNTVTLTEIIMLWCDVVGSDTLCFVWRTAKVRQETEALAELVRHRVNE